MLRSKIGLMAVSAMKGCSRNSRPLASAWHIPCCHFSNEKIENKNQISTKEKFIALWKKYGLFAVGTYFSFYFATLGTLFLLFDNDVITASLFGFENNEACIKAVCDKLEMLTGHETIPNYIRENHRVGIFSVAWFTTKFTEPFRLGATILLTPKIAKVLGKHAHE